MNVRVASPEDGAAVVRCVADAYRKYVARLGGPPASMKRDLLPAIERGDVRVCESAGEVVGVMLVTRREDHVEVSSLAVKPGHQRRGIGTALMRAAEELASASGTAVVRLFTNAALPELIRYYERLGYVRCGRRVDDGYDRVFLEKNVRSSA